MLVYFGSRRERESWNWAWVISTRLARQLGYLELLFKLMFVNPPELPEQTTRALPVRWRWQIQKWPITFLMDCFTKLVLLEFLLSVKYSGGDFIFYNQDSNHLPVSLCHTGFYSRTTIACPASVGRRQWLRWSLHSQMPVRGSLASWPPGSSGFSRTMKLKVTSMCSVLKSG